ncbi:hypothetical protein S40285_09202 [Stachybotrys chlorohalonatus IBT 40285]|uniref:U1-type domain-containing protein n=1 Tax=Stachybotrys chlorohalonatus (strain IBT 40285) TaxID=1283841 RepID=A0A084Q9A6_STAC4|nr:hypothetical protein S40285_09202 [Stachybotrys chlorohalonata IBT 40285]
MEVKSPPSFCRLCEVPLASSSEWRQHAKSDWHVYKLRLRVAEPGTVVTPPAASPRPEHAAPAGNDADADHESEDEDDVEISAESEFHAERCIFCDANNDTLDDSLAHMSKTHSFTIPHQDCLAVEIETLLRYLHLVIHGYGECIQCGARRGTVEGIQHHMTAKGHCRFDVASDMAEFYNIPALEYHADERSLRLPSGRLLNHRTRASGPATSRAARHAAARRLEPTTSSSTTAAPGSEIIPIQDNETFEASSSQLARLTRGDQQSLAHLPDHQVRSLLATSARAIEQSQRQEKIARVRLDRAGNLTLFAHFRQDTSKRFRGVWG